MRPSVPVEKRLISRTPTRQKTVVVNRPVATIDDTAVRPVKARMKKPGSGTEAVFAIAGPYAMSLKIERLATSGGRQLREIVSCRLRTTRATDVHAANSAASTSGGIGESPVLSNRRAASGWAAYWL